MSDPVGVEDTPHHLLTQPLMISSPLPQYEVTPLTLSTPFEMTLSEITFPSEITLPEHPVTAEHQPLEATEAADDHNEMSDVTLYAVSEATQNALSLQMTVAGSSEMQGSNDGVPKLMWKQK